MKYYPPLDPKTMKHEEFKPQYMGVITPKNEGNVGSYGSYIRDCNKL